jgi:hypothetical protein
MTHIMPDGSVMNMEDMSSPEMGTAGEAASGHAEHGAATEAAGTSEESAHASMGGAIDWQVIALIIGLIAACVAVTTAVNEYLRRRAAGGACGETEATDG